MPGFALFACWIAEVTWGYKMFLFILLVMSCSGLQFIFLIFSPPLFSHVFLYMCVILSSLSQEEAQICSLVFSLCHPTSSTSNVQVTQSDTGEGGLQTSWSLSPPCHLPPGITVHLSAWQVVAVTVPHYLPDVDLGACHWSSPTQATCCADR